MSDLTRDNDKKYIAKGWDGSEEEAKKAGAWIKLDAGQHINIVPVGDPEVFETVFEDKTTGQKKPQKRWSIDVWSPAEKRLLTWEMSRTTFGDLKRQRQIRGDKFSNCVFRLERQGSGLTTKYSLDYLSTLEGNDLDEKNAAMIKAGLEVPF